MSAGPIAQDRAGHTVPRASTTDKERRCAKGPTGRGYCGRKTKTPRTEMEHRHLLRLPRGTTSGRSGRRLPVQDQLIPATHASTNVPWTGAAALIHPEPWMQEALCAETEPDAFFPEKGGSTREAKSICARCDVREDCLEYALRAGERFGIWGGKSERQLRHIRVIRGIRAAEEAAAPGAELTAEQMRTPLTADAAARIVSEMREQGAA